MKQLFTFLFLILCFGANAQNSVSMKAQSFTDWTIYASNASYEIQYKVVNCDPSMGYDQEMVILRIENKTTNNIAVDWQMILYYSGECKTCDYLDEYHYSVVIEAGSEIVGGCSINDDYQLKIFSKFIDTNYSKGDQLTSFELGNLNVQM